MNDLQEKIADYKLQHPESDIFSIEDKGERLWVKYSRKTASNLLHKFVYAITKNPLLIPVEYKTAKETLHFEVKKLQRLITHSINVPKVVMQKKEYFVLQDRGPTIAHLFYHHQVQDNMQLCQQVIEQIAKLHNLNEYHGGSQIKNFTYKDQKVYMIDFEESFSPDTDIEELQFRDLFLFFFSVSKMHIDVDYAMLMTYYSELTHQKNTKEKMRRLSQSVNFLMKLIENKVIWKLLDKDTKSVYRLLKILNNDQ